MGKHERLKQITELIQTQRWAALATIDQSGRPEASMVAYAMASDGNALYLHLSRLAAHTGNLLANPSCSVVITETDDGRPDPQQLARLAIQGDVEVVERDSPAYKKARTSYLERLPESEPLFEFPDFVLFRLKMETLRFVGGFGQAFTYRCEELQAEIG